MPGVEENLPAEAVYAEHPGRLTILYDIDSVVAIERVGIFGRLIAGVLLIQVLLCSLKSRFSRGYRHSCRDSTGAVL